MKEVIITLIGLIASGIDPTTAQVVAGLARR